MKKRLIAVLIILLILLAASIVARRSGNGRDRNALILSGNVEVTEVNVAYRIPGRVTALYTDEGRVVQKGERLALLDSAEYASRVAQNRANLKNAEVQLEKAMKDLERYEILYKKEVISTQQIDSARTTYEVAVARVQQADAEVRAAEVLLGDTILFAPVSGVVLRKNVEAGETVGAGTPLVTIGNIEAPWVKVYVKETKLGLVKLGQKVQVTTDSYPGKIYEGTVTYISSEAEFTPKNVQTQEERVKLVFAVKITVSNEQEELKPGMPADVRIPLQTNHDIK